MDFLIALFMSGTLVLLIGILVTLVGIKSKIEEANRNRK
jgi:hypothetical protein